ncbi:MAG: ABC transporter ATP-binding protein [Bacteroidota bacterium]
MRSTGTYRKLFQVLTPSERRRVYLLVPAIILMALLQVAGIGSVAPFLQVVADPSSVETNEWLARVYNMFGFTTTEGFLMALGCVTLTLLVLGNVFNTLVAWAMARFTQMRRHSLSMRLLKSYLYRPYLYYLRTNSAELGKNLLYEVNEIVNGILQPCMVLVARGVVSVFIFALLIAVDPLLSVGAFVVFGGAYSLIYLSVKRKLLRTGKERVAANGQRFKIASEAFMAVKDVKLLHLEEPFLDRFSKPSRTFAERLVTQNVIAKIPQYAMETLAFGGILLIVLYYIALDKNVAEIIPLLGVYAYAILRLKPNLQEVYISMAKISFNDAALARIYDDLNGQGDAINNQRRRRKEVVRDNAVPFENAVALRNVTFGYPESAPLFHDLSLTIRKGESVGFVGPTGSGKTTVVDLLLGLLRPQDGALVVDDQAVTDDLLPAWQKHCGYVPQNIVLIDDTVASNIAFGEPTVDMDAVIRAAKAANIHDFIKDGLEDGYETMVGERGIRLSGGQRQRIGIARALYHNPQVLVFDEATSALDNETERAVMQAIEALRGERTLITIAHRLSTVQSCDQLFFLEKGTLTASGTFDELVAANEQFERMALANA